MSFEMIISEVQSRPELWLSSHPLFKNRIVAKKKWNEIAMKLEITVDVLKKRWKHLKDQFRKELKKHPVSRSGAAAEYWVSTWQFYNLMEFIRDELIPEPTTGNINWASGAESLSSVGSEAVSENDTESSTSGTEPSSSTSSKRTLNAIREDMLDLEKKKIKLIEQRVAISQADNDLKNDPDVMYFMSIIPNVKKLNEIEKLRFKTKVNNILLDLLTENDFNNYIDESTCSQHNWPPKTTHCQLYI